MGLANHVIVNNKKEKLATIEKCMFDYIIKNKEKEQVDYLEFFQ
jgi:hypothetical protein